MPGLWKLDRIVVGNYRSILHCEADLEAVTFFVGLNGSGKTSLVDAVAFIADGLRNTLEQAVNSRAGVFTLFHAPVKPPCSFSVQLSLSSADGFRGTYFIEVRSDDGRGIYLGREECHVNVAGGQSHFYAVENGIVRGTPEVLPPATRDRLYLVNASGLQEFRPFYDFLSGISSAEPSTRGLYWERAHLPSGLTARFSRVLRVYPDIAELIETYLRAISPSFRRLEVVDIEQRTWLRFIDSDSPSDTPNAFYISQVSAGMLHAAEILLEIFTPPEGGRPASPVLLEEPEALLHPAAVRVLRDAFVEAGRFRQILVTSHSSDLLDDSSIPGEWIRIVDRDRLGTHVRALDDATKSIIRDRLFTPGELLRQGGLSGISTEPNGDEAQRLLSGERAGA